MAPYSSTLAWKIPWTEEPGRLQSIRSWRVGHDWETSLSLFTFMLWRRKRQPTPVFLPGESQGRGSRTVGHNWSDLAAAAAVFSSPICSPLGPGFVCWYAEAKFLFPLGYFLLSLPIPILSLSSCCSLLWYETLEGWGTAKGMGLGGGAEHFFPSEMSTHRVMPTTFALGKISFCGSVPSTFREFRNFCD